MAVVRMMTSRSPPCTSQEQGNHCRRAKLGGANPLCTCPHSHSIMQNLIQAANHMCASTPIHALSLANDKQPFCLPGRSRRWPPAGSAPAAAPPPPPAPRPRRRRRRCQRSLQAWLHSWSSRRAPGQRTAAASAATAPAQAGGGPAAPAPAPPTHRGGWGGAWPSQSRTQNAACSSRWSRQHCLP